MEEFKDKKSKANNKILYGFLLAAAVIAYNFIWLNRTFTMSEGWTKVYISMMQEGKTVYKDFFYFLPPLNLLMDSVFWKLSGGYFFVFRLWRLLERVLLAELIYSFLCIKAKPCASFFVSITAVFMFSANTHDLIGDYNQSAQVGVVLLTYIVYKYFESIEAGKKGTIYLFFAGVAGGLIFGIKQPSTIACVLVFGLFFIIRSFVDKRINLWKVIITVVLGACVPLAVMSIYLLSKGCFGDFINCVFVETGSKGTLLGILVGSQVLVFKNRIRLVLAVALLFASKYINQYKNIPHKKRILIATRLVAAALFCNLYLSVVLIALANEISTLHIFAFGISVLLLFATRKSNRVFSISLIAILLGNAMLLFANIDRMTEYFYSPQMFGMMTEYITCIHVFILVWIIYRMILYKKQGVTVDLYTLILAVGAFASGYSTSMSAGNDLVISFAAIISVPAFVTILVYEMSDNKTTKQGDGLVHTRLRFCLGVIMTLFFTICMTQKLCRPYAWWGHEGISYWKKTETSDIKCLKGFKLSPTEKRMYDGLNDLILYYAKPDSVIWGFPYNKVYNVFQSNYNTDTYTPVLFYDVCPDSAAIREAEELKDNPPDFVVWIDIYGCVNSHERFYRNGKKCGQRDIQSWFCISKKTDYELIGQVSNVFVYKRIDDTVIDKTYILSPNKINESSNYVGREYLIKNHMEEQ